MVHLADQGEVDRELISQFDARVKTICRFGAVTARLLAQPGCGGK